MSALSFLWSLAAGAALTLGGVHALVWLSDRRAYANLTFAILAFLLACMVPIELHLMHSGSPAEYGEWLRWAHVPVFGIVVGTVLFVHLYLGTGRKWLAVTVIALRCVVLAVNFAITPNINYARIGSLVDVSFLGGTVVAVGESEVGPWQWIATVSLILATAYVIDATVRLWRRGDRDARRRALVVGGGVMAFVVLSVVQTQLVIWGLSRMPVLITPPFLVTLFAMASELSGEIIRAARLTRELRESEQRLDLAASAAGLGIWVRDVASRTVQATDKARGLHGVHDNAPIDVDRWMAGVHSEDLDGLRLEMQRALEAGGEFTAEYRVVQPRGGTRWVAMRGRAETEADGTPAVIRGVVRDITESKQARDETEKLRRDLTHAGRVTMLGQLSSALAHELNQPLGAILRNAEAAAMLLQSNAPDLDELRAIVSDIRKDDRRAVDVISRLRALLSRRSLEPEPVPVQGVVQDVLALVRADAAARQVRLDFAPPVGLSPASADRVHLSQVLLNLIVNAMDAVAHLPASSRRVAVEARLAHGMIEIAVADSGGGIAPELAEKVFDPYYTTKSGGMGMGLPISRTIVEAHGGKLWVDDASSPGATFRFTLPLSQHDRA